MFIFQSVHSRPGPPSLGHLVSSLKEVADSYFANVESLQQIEKKVDGVQNMTSEEMKQVVVVTEHGIHDKNVCFFFYSNT